MAKASYAIDYPNGRTAHTIEIDGTFLSAEQLANMIAVRHNLKWWELGRENGTFYRKGKAKDRFRVEWSITR